MVVFSLAGNDQPGANEAATHGLLPYGGVRALRPRHLEPDVLEVARAQAHGARVPQQPQLPVSMYSQQPPALPNGRDLCGRNTFARKDGRTWGWRKRGIRLLSPCLMCTISCSHVSLLYAFLFFCCALRYFCRICTVLDKTSMFGVTSTKKDGEQKRHHVST